MFHALKIGAIVVVLGLIIQDADAFGHRGWGGGCGYGGDGYGGDGYGGYRPSSDSVLLTVSVPADAKVFVNGQSTRSTGELRQYVSSGLQPAAIYGYRVRAEFVRDGKSISEEKTVELTAGQTGSLAFSTPANAQASDMATSAVR